MISFFHPILAHRAKGGPVMSASNKGKKAHRHRYHLLFGQPLEIDISCNIWINERCGNHHVFYYPIQNKVDGLTYHIWNADEYVFFTVYDKHGEVVDPTHDKRFEKSMAVYFPKSSDTSPGVSFSWTNHGFTRMDKLIAFIHDSSSSSSSSS